MSQQFFTEALKKKKSGTGQEYVTYVITKQFKFKLNKTKNKKKKKKMNLFKIPTKIFSNELKVNDR